MTAQVEEVKAFKSIDGKVYATFILAHHANIKRYCEQLFRVDYHDEPERQYSADMLYRLLIDPSGPGLVTKNAVKNLARELE